MDLLKVLDYTYFGIRRLPYTTNLGKNPLTFKHISDNATLPTTVKYSYAIASLQNSDVQNAGEFWCLVL